MHLVKSTTYKHKNAAVRVLDSLKRIVSLIPPAGLLRLKREALDVGSGSIYVAKNHPFPDEKT